MQRILQITSIYSPPRLCNCHFITIILLYQASQPLGFSRQEHWSGLPFPFPMHESEVKVMSLSHVGLVATPWTAAYQDPLSMGFCRQEYWSGLPFPSPGDLPNPGTEPRSPALQAGSLLSEPPGKPRIQ